MYEGRRLWLLKPALVQAIKHDHNNQRVKKAKETDTHTAACGPLFIMPLCMLGLGLLASLCSFAFVFTTLLSSLSLQDSCDLCVCIFIRPSEHHHQSSNHHLVMLLTASSVRWTKVGKESCISLSSPASYSHLSFGDLPYIKPPVYQMHNLAFA